MNSTASTNEVRPLNRKRLIASAARKANSRQNTTVVRVIATLMPSAGQNEPSRKMAAKLSSEPPSGRKRGVVEVSTVFGSSELFSIQ